MSSSASSSASESPPPSSPEVSVHQGPPSLERLVAHFVSAKRSLTSISHVWRANEVVTSSRALVEEIALLRAKNTFARHGVDDQVDVLQTIRANVADAGEIAAREFTTTLAALDEANDRLQATLKKLRQTVVDSALRRTTTQTLHDEARDDPKLGDEAVAAQETEQGSSKTLYDFIDESRHADVLDSLHALIDSYKDAKESLHGSLGSFDDSIRTIADTLQEGAVSGSSPQTKRTLYDSLTPAPTITQLFRGMEGHAAEMATLLQSLISHYDLCVNALKHTDGGGEAAKLAMQKVDALTLRAGPPGTEEESLYQKTAPEPITEAERTEMLRVLVGDAGQVEEVRAEMSDHAEGMETQYEQLTRHALEARAGHKALRSVLEQLHGIKAALPAHVNASRVFQDTWQGIHSTIAGRTEELAGLRMDFDEFLASYASLLREVERRRGAEVTMRKLALKAQKELDKLFAVDREAREEFTSEVGVSLPGDIWPGAREVGTRWEVKPVKR
ncbi:autophagy protein 17 [Teratosphaeriaceae sp. CCFEE 6253]|nr:autophagy protein 17 [Teratosphaeriaceae sp. CCFEE 6253]